MQGTTGSGRRRLKAAAQPAGSAGTVRALPPPAWQNPDQDLTRGPSLYGAPGTYNHLTDSVLRVKATRAM